MIGASCPDRYDDTKDDKRGADYLGSGGIVPRSDTVILGCVSGNGSECPVDTGRCSGMPLIPVFFNQTRNGIEGMVMFTMFGNGFRMLACACRFILCSSVVTLKDSSVTRSANSGKGAFLPGWGKPGRSGTINICVSEANIRQCE